MWTAKTCEIFLKNLQLAQHLHDCNLHIPNYLILSDAKGGSRTGAPPPRFEKNYGFVFVNFDCITRIYFDFSQ